MDKLITPYDFRIKEVLITSDRFKDKPPLNVTPITFGFEVFEDINIPYLTGTLGLVDDNDLQNIYGFTGTERVSITVALPGLDQEITNNFIMMSFKDKKRSGNTDVIYFNLIEEHAFLSNSIEFSKFYDGTAGSIIKKICKDKLNVEVNTSKAKKNYQPEFRYIVPYQNPLQAASQVLKKATTENGLPYFFYSTFLDEALCYKDLETMISEEPFEKFIYSQAFSSAAISYEPRIRGKAIEKVKLDSNKDTLLLAQMGVYGSDYSYFDVQTGKSQNTHINVYQVYENLNFQKIFPKGQNQPPFPKNVLPDNSLKSNKTLDQYDSKYIHQISSSTYPFDGGVNNFSEEENDVSYYSGRVTSESMRQILYHNEIGVRIPGFHFCYGSNRGVGNALQIDIYKNAPDVQDELDAEKSGNYIITSKKHTFDTLKNESTVDLGISKIANLEVTI